MKEAGAFKPSEDVTIVVKKIYSLINLLKKVIKTPQLSNLNRAHG